MDTLDFSTEMYEGFNELTYIINESDIEMIGDAEALWQAIEGEIKTPLGVIKGIGQENYGCRIWELLGQGLTNLEVRTAESFVGQLAYNYQIEVNQFTEVKVTPYGREYLRVDVTVDSIYGIFTGVTHIAVHIRNPIRNRERPNIIKTMNVLNR